MITALRLQSFRSYDDTNFNLNEGVHIIVGPNASGKTNLLEAVLVAARGASYRGRDTELVMFGQPWARVDAQTPAQSRTVKIIAGPNPVKTFDIDGQTLVRLPAARTLPVVLFEPNHLLLLTAAPDLRRAFLDDLIEQIEPGYGATRRHYRRVLAQRNALLKHHPTNLTEQLFVWNLRLSELGGRIARRRQQLIDDCNTQLTSLYSELADTPTDVTLSYATRFSADSYESQLLHKLESNIQAEVERGFTAYGPHRDDLVATIGGRTVQEAASRGETRSLVLVLKLLELRLLESARGTKPMLLLDDVFSELDTRRRQALTAHVQTHQTFITTTDADIIARHFASCTVIDLAHHD